MQLKNIFSKGRTAILVFAITVVTASFYFVFTGGEVKAESQMLVYKSPECGCCDDWVDHVEQAGFSAKIQHSESLSAIKSELGISPVYQSCHTGVFQDYVFEGHIPADVIQTFLLNKPNKAIGLAVPGMPLGSPGMDVEGEFRPYQVLQINKDGSSRPYAEVSINQTRYFDQRP